MSDCRQDHNKKDIPIGGPYDHCIYCGPETPAFSKEHIVPEGMGGRFVLCKASCKDCADQTGLNERQLMQGSWHAARKALGIKGKKRKKRNTIYYDPDAKLASDREVSLTDATIYLSSKEPDSETRFSELVESKVASSFTNAPFIMPFFVTSGWPKILVPGSEPIVVPFPIMPEDQRDRAEATRAEHTPDDETTAIGVQSIFMPRNVSRLVAKVAHCAAVANFGPTGFEPFLIDHILGRDTGVCIDYIAAFPDRNDSEHLHEFSSFEAETNAGNFVSAKVRLFAKLRTPTFHVVVGRPIAV